MQQTTRSHRGQTPRRCFARQHRVCGCSSLCELDVHRGQTPHVESRPISPKSASVCHATNNTIASGSDPAQMFQARDNIGCADVHRYASGCASGSDPPSRVGRFLRNRQAFVHATNNTIASGSDRCFPRDVHGVRPRASRVGRFLRNRQAFVYATNNTIASGSDPTLMFGCAAGSDPALTQLARQDVHRGQTPMGDD